MTASRAVRVLAFLGGILLGQGRGLPGEPHCADNWNERFTDDFYFTASSDQGAVGDLVAVDLSLTIEDLRHPELAAFTLVGCYLGGTRYENYKTARGWNTRRWGRIGVHIGGPLMFPPYTAFELENPCLNASTGYTLASGQGGPGADLTCEHTSGRCFPCLRSSVHRVVQAPPKT